MEAADVNGDGWKDLLIACAGSGPGARDTLLINDKIGGFLNETAQRLPALTESSQDIKAADLDGDGDKDIVFCNLTCNGCGTFTRNPQARLLINDGKGKFADETSSVMPAGASGRLWDVEAADLDKDGALDVFMGAWGNPGDSDAGNGGSAGRGPQRKQAAKAGFRPETETQDRRPRAPYAA